MFLPIKVPALLGSISLPRDIIMPISVVIAWLMQNVPKSQCNMLRDTDRRKLLIDNLFFGEDFKQNMNATSGTEIVRYYKTFEDWYELGIRPRSCELDFSTESTFRKMYILPSHAPNNTDAEYPLNMMHLRSSINCVASTNVTS